MNQNSMFPRLLTCEHCGKTAVVKAYLPIYKDGWMSPPAEEPILKAMTYILDCAECGVRNQIRAMESGESEKPTNT